VEWVFVLSKQPEQEAKDLALDMELYVEGSLDIAPFHERWRGKMLIG